MSKGRCLLSSGMVVLVWALAPGRAFAYIDPGNGAYMVQALFTVIGAAFFYLRHPIRSLRGLADSLASRWKRFRGFPVDAPQPTENSAENVGSQLCPHESPE